MQFEKNYGNVFFILFKKRIKYGLTVTNPKPHLFYTDSTKGKWFLDILKMSKNRVIP